MTVQRAHWVRLALRDHEQLLDWLGTVRRGLKDPSRNVMADLGDRPEP